MLGCYDGGKLALEELHRFPNEPVGLGGTLYWDILRLLHEIRQGLRRRTAGAAGIRSIGIDTWGVDFGLLGADGRLLENPVHYRDARTAGSIEAAGEIFPLPAFYRETGLQFMTGNTVFQLFALARQRPALLERAERLLFLPDLLGYFLTGERTTEESIARTSQLLRVEDGAGPVWSERVFETLGLPRRLVGEIVPAGTPLGPLLPESQEETGLSPVPVISVCGHDTQSAVCAVPSGEAGSEFAFLSSGTWSLLGTELERPIADDKAYKYNITNEGGLGKTRFLKNITGLWLIQESRRAWARAGESYSYADLERLALDAPAFRRFLDPDDPAFGAPGDIPARIRDVCRRGGQRPPETVGETVRCIYESLAMQYRRTLERLQDCTGKRYARLHVIGGGVKDTLLCQMTANACGIPVLAGPAEATVLGNLAVQLMAQGELTGLAEARELIARSFPVREYLPRDEAAWQEGYGEFLRKVG
jgi:rhamnulokinase/L-fuculokinase